MPTLVINAIDPGPKTHGFVELEYVPEAYNYGEEWPIYLRSAEDAAKTSHLILDKACSPGEVWVCEGVQSYGRVVGRSVLDTAWNAGRIEGQHDYDRVYTNPEIKDILCGRRSVKEPQLQEQVREIIGTVNGMSGYEVKVLKGTKVDPGPLYGIKGHAWSALAVAIAYLWEYEGLAARYREARRLA